jgi:hypothetical protein
LNVGIRLTSLLYQLSAKDNETFVVIPQEGIGDKSPPKSERRLLVATLTLFNTITKSLLTSVPYFQALDDHGLRSVTQEVIVRHYSAGEVVFLESDPGKGLHLVVEGLCKVYHLSLEGREHILHLL